MNGNQSSNGLQGRRIHPALHFQDSFACVGIVDVSNNGWIITSGRQATPLDNAVGVTFLTPPRVYPEFAERWDISDLRRWMGGESPPSFGDTVVMIRDLLDMYIEFRRPQESALVACWIVGTYFYLLFPAFPRLHLQGERESGKSKLLHGISLLAFNGLLRLNPTPAVLFRMISPLRPTFCLDEVESLAGEEHRTIISIINTGYKAGGCVDRCAGDRWQDIDRFEVYAPVALGGIAGVNPTTESRCVSFLMERGRDKEKLNREIVATDPTFAELRNRCYRLTLTAFPDVSQQFGTLGIPEWLNGRLRELYKPLLTVAALADKTSDADLSKDVLALAGEDLANRSTSSLETEAILDWLEHRLGSNNQIEVQPKVLALASEEVLGYRINPERAGQAFRRLGFERNRTSRGTFYVVTRDRLNELAARHATP